MITITCKVYTRKEHEKIYYDQKTNLFHIHINQIPTQGKANNAVIKILSKKIEVPQYQIKIISGMTTTIKIIQIHTTILNLQDIQNLLLLLPHK